jgi:sensor domain CHASE-containing protein
MNIRLKVMSLVALLFAVLTAAAVIVQQRTIRPSFARLEQANAQTSMKRIRYAMDRSMEALQVTSLDWSNWADAYRFVQDRNPDFVRTNVTNASLKTLQINAMVLVDLEGRVVLRSDNTLDRDAWLDGTVLAGTLLRGDFPWRQVLGTMKTSRGLIRTRRGILMISGAPILDGTGGGKPRGMAIMGRLLTPERLRGFGSQTQSHLQLVEDRLAGTSERIVESDAVTQVYGSFEDVYGRPLMTLRVDVPREITAIGEAAIHYASASLVAAAVVVLIMLLVLLNRLVLAPLTRMTRHAAEIGAQGNLSARLNFDSGDEFGQLAREFDRMVERLAHARRELVDQSFQAGFAEMAKGVLHNLGNALTPLGVRLTLMEQRMRTAPAADLERASSELAGGPADSDRSADLVEFMKLGCREMAVMVCETEADIALMQRQTALMRASLTEQLCASAHQTPVMETVTLPALIAQSLEIVPDASRRLLQVDVDKSLQQVGAVPVARTVLRLVLQNLIINAADAVRDAGMDRGVLKVAAEIVAERDREQLHLHCEDNGVGIPTGDLERVFDKGFSTKSRDSNHGIGLHWCANAIGALGGRIWAVSEGPGHGAALHLILPLGARPAGSMT